jgi:predicted N-acetyltransferase YhbS
MPAMTIGTYDESAEPQVYALWQASLGDRWPLSRRAFHHITLESGAYQPGDHLIAQGGDAIVGFVGTQTRTFPNARAPRAAVIAIMVEPSQQRRGVGRALLEAALASLEQKGVTEVQLGGGGISYFWAGVPANLPEAWSFFQACGWPRVETSFDLVRELRGYSTPPDIHERVRQQQITLQTATPADVPAVLAFEERHFPNWLHAFERVVAYDEAGDILLARDARQAIVGTTLVLAAESRSWRDRFVWGELLGEKIGGVGPLGVAEEMRSKGIGLALAARVTELLQERGVETSYVGWTWLVDWYGRLGYRIWQEHTMSWKKP